MNCLIRIGLSAALLFGVSVNAWSADKPLLQAGKKTLYQRVLTTPGCKLVVKPGDQSGAAQEAFSR